MQNDFLKQSKSISLDEILRNLPPLLTCDEIAQILRASRATIYALINRGELKAIKCGRLVRVERDEFINFIEKRRNKQESEENKKPRVYSNAKFSNVVSINRRGRDEEEDEYEVL